MVSDPRCPACSGKVSATATWCMHCGEEFEQPVDADSGRAVENRHSGGVDSDQLGTDDGSAGPTAVGVAVAVFGLVTLPFVTPPGMTLFYLAAAVGAGLVAAAQSSTGEAVARGGTALGATPVVLWFLSALVLGTGASPGGLVPALVYSILVSSAARRTD